MSETSVSPEKAPDVQALFFAVIRECNRTRALGLDPVALLANREPSR